MKNKQLKKFSFIQDKFTLYIALIALGISLLTFYFQFIYVNKAIFITPVYPDSTDKNGEIVYKHVFTNSGSNSVTIFDKEAFLHPKEYQIEDIDSIALQVPSNTNDVAVLSPGSTYISEIILTEDEYKNYDKRKGSITMITFVFEIVDHQGNVLVLDYEACALPKKINGEKENRSYVIDTNEVDSKCNVSINIFE